MFVLHLGIFKQIPCEACKLWIKSYHLSQCFFLFFERIPAHLMDISIEFSFPSFILEHILISPSYNILKSRFSIPYSISARHRDGRIESSRDICTLLFCKVICIDFFSHPFPDFIDFLIISAFIYENNKLISAVSADFIIISNG